MMKESSPELRLFVIQSPRMPAFGTPAGENPFYSIQWLPYGLHLCLAPVPHPQISGSEDSPCIQPVSFFCFAIQIHEAIRALHSFPDQRSLNRDPVLPWQASKIWKYPPEASQRSCRWASPVLMSAWPLPQKSFCFDFCWSSCRRDAPFCGLSKVSKLS